MTEIVDGVTPSRARFSERDFGGRAASEEFRSLKRALQIWVEDFSDALRFQVGQERSQDCIGIVFGASGGGSENGGIAVVCADGGGEFERLLLE